MRGKTLVVALLAAVLVAFGGIVLLAFTGGSSHVPRSAPGVGFTTDKRAADTDEPRRDPRVADAAASDVAP